MQSFIESVMTFNTYPDQTPEWKGWEYIPKTEHELQMFAKATGFQFYEEVEEGCLQYCPLTNRYVVAIDGFVEEISRKEFIKILTALSETK